MLYIDDLFKAYNGQIDKEDFNLTMNLLNIRYKENENNDYINRTYTYKLKIDRALGGRIYERTTQKGGIVYQSQKNDEKDYRKKF